MSSPLQIRQLALLTTVTLRAHRVLPLSSQGTWVFMLSSARMGNVSVTGWPGPCSPTLWGYFTAAISRNTRAMDRPLHFLPVVLLAQNVRWETEAFEGIFEVSLRHKCIFLAMDGQVSLAHHAETLSPVPRQRHRADERTPGMHVCCTCPEEVDTSVSF